MNATQTEIEESLTCQCGCGLTVHSCNHLQCPSGIPLKKEIGEQLALGKTRPEVLAYFSGKYGEKILSAPTTTGFNVIAWIMPFAVVLTAGAILAVVIQRRTRGTPPGPPSPPAAGGSGASPGDAAMRARLARELDAFDRDDSEGDT